MNSIYFLAPASKIRESCSFSVVFPTQIESFRVCLLDETNPFEGLKGTWGVVMIFCINKQSFFFSQRTFWKEQEKHTMALERRHEQHQRPETEAATDFSRVFIYVLLVCFLLL